MGQQEASRKYKREADLKSRRRIKTNAPQSKTKTNTLHTVPLQKMANMAPQHSTRENRMRKLVT